MIAFSRISVSYLVFSSALIFLIVKMMSWISFTFVADSIISRSPSVSALIKSSQTSTGLFFLVFLSFFSSKKTIENLSVRMLYLDSSRAFAMWLVFKPINTAGFYSASFLTETYAKFGNIFVLFIS